MQIGTRPGTSELSGRIGATGKWWPAHPASPGRSPGSRRWRGCRCGSRRLAGWIGRGRRRPWTRCAIVAVRHAAPGSCPRAPRKREPMRCRGDPVARADEAGELFRCPRCKCTRPLRPDEDGFRLYREHQAYCPLAGGAQRYAATIPSFRTFVPRSLSVQGDFSREILPGRSKPRFRIGRESRKSPSARRLDANPEGGRMRRLANSKLKPDIDRCEL